MAYDSLKQNGHYIYHVL